MHYITKFIESVTRFDIILLPLISTLMLIFCLANLCKNPYRRQNRKLTAITRKICSFPHKTAQFANTLPPDYRRQWRAYQNSGAKQPSLVFEFVPRKNGLYCWRTFVLAALLNTVYIVAFALNTSHRDYLIFQIVFWLAFALLMITNKLVFDCHERKAKRVFARLLNELNRCDSKEPAQEENIDDTVKELRKLQKCEPTNAIFCKASQLLRSKGLNDERTVAEQRKLNGALNGLLQTYTRASGNV